MSRRNSPTAADETPAVSMLVRNPYTHDTRVEKEARSLRQAGYRVAVIADAAPGLADQETSEGVTIVRVQRTLGRVPIVRFLAGELARARTLVATRPDILHAHDSNALLPVWLAARRLRRPFVYDAHELWLGRPRRQRSRAYFWLSQAWYGPVERLLIPRAAGWLTVSAPIVAHLQRKYRLPRVTLVENFPESDYARETASRPLRELAPAGAIPPDAPIVLHIGGLMSGRGIEQLVDAMCEVPAAHLVLLGDGYLAGDLGRRAADLGIRDRVHRLGPVPGTEVIRYARTATVGVAPIVPSSLNNRYSLPNKLFQYMAASLPVVASDLPQVREVVAAAGCGRTVDTRSPAAIAEAIREILADPEAARALGERGRNAILERYNWDRAGARLISAYATIRAALEQRK